MSFPVFPRAARARRGVAAGVTLVLGVPSVLGLASAVALLGVPADAARATGDVSVTVPAPGAGPDATVTVSRTTELVNQTVLVSWAGFRPSSASRLDNSGDSLDVNTDFPVRVYQCRGADPVSSSDCYGSQGFRGAEASGDAEAVPAVPPYTYPGQQNAFDATPDGPANWQDNVTRADGTGEVTIQLFTKRESASLGCDDDTPCSIVVVPNYGRGETSRGATEDLLDAPWAWERRTVVPLEFLPVDDACPLTGSGLRVEGSPVIGHALASWRARTCTLATDSVRVDFTSIGEPQTRADLASGTTDVGLVIDPLETAAAKERGVVYAPITVTGLVIAFQIDDADGKPVSDLKLNPRLVAKIITGSYRSGGNEAVIKNPVNLFRDPEFRALNPDVKWPGGAPGNHPLLLGDLSDTTLALTRWINADADARAFLAGEPDPYGMTVNANYKDVKLPFASFPLLDPLLTQTFEPIQELDAVARQLSIARFPGALVTVENGVNITTKPPRQNPGRREVIGIIDAASAARFRLPTARLLNGAGNYVAPTPATMLAGIKASTLNKDGVTRQVDPASTIPNAYPLTLLISAGLSTEADEESRAQMADLLSYIRTSGQQPGEEVGQLPEGHAPLSPALRAQLTKARAAVLAGPADDGGDGGGDGDGGDQGDGDNGDGDGDTDTGTDTGTDTDPSVAPTDGGDGPPSAPGGTDPEPTETPDGAPLDEEPAQVDTALVSSIPKGAKQLMIPLLLSLAVLTAGGGPLLWWLDRTGRGPAWLRR
ncbi:hypothetical protein [Nocardioides sp.]|uniref:hypothetical protein n=1 Tax=Nocardioides sp. TaxID=35761 RepID=UPI003511BFCD